MSERYLSDNNGIEWHVHDIYEGAGGNVRHGHHAGKAPHAHDWDEAIPVIEERDGFFIEAERLRREQANPVSVIDQQDSPPESID